jgi:menaquinone-dependent protoporphyrinogen IX oxidase
MNLATGDFQERTPVKCLILYQSRKETQNTKKIAEHMALAIKADLMPIDRVEEININDYDIVGFGSGVYMRHLGKQLIKYVQNLPPKKQEAFIFYTSGAQVVDRARDKFSRLLQSKGRTVIGS